METIVLDTNILIEILKGNNNTIKIVQSFNAKSVISSISVMELYYGAINKAELKKLEKGDGYARIELSTLKVTDSYNLNSKELKKLLKIVDKNRIELQRSWDDYFNE